MGILIGGDGYTSGIPTKLDRSITHIVVFGFVDGEMIGGDQGIWFGLFHIIGAVGNDVDSNITP